MINEFFDKVIQKLGLESMSELGAYIPGSVNRVLDSIHHPYPKSELLPYINYNETTEIYYNDGESLGFVYEVAPSVSLDEVSLRQLKGFLQDQLPEDSHMQVLLLASDKIESQLERWLSQKQKNEFLDPVWERRANFLRDVSKFKVDDVKFKARDFRLFVSFSIAKRGRSVVEAEEEIKLLQMQVKSLFEILEIPYISLKPIGLLNLLDEILNYKRQEDNRSKPYNTTKPIAAQISRMDSVMAISDHEINLDANKFFTRCYSVDKFPEYVPPNCTNFLLGDQLRDGLNLPCRFMISYSISATVNSTKKQMMISKGNAARRNAESFVTKFSPRIRNEAIEWRDVIDRLESGERFFTTCFQVSITDTRENITYSDQVLKNIFSSRGWAISEDKFFHLPALIGMLPMAQGAGYADIYKYFEHSKTSLVEEALTMLPFTAEFKGTDTPGMLLICPRGQLMQWNPFSTGANNFNTMIVAPSGGGKSVNVQEFLLNLLSLGSQNYIIDLGRSYQKIASLIGADFIEFDPNHPICLNPFTHIDQKNTDDVDSTLDFIKELICIMANPAGPLSSLEQAIISEAIGQVWAMYKNEADIDLIADRLTTEGSVEAKNLSKMLYPFTSKGSFGKFFIGKADIDFKKKFYVLEFERILSKKGLFPVVFALATNLIGQKLAKGDRSQRVMFTMDEIHVFTKVPGGTQSLDLATRILRKYNAAFTGATQSYKTDFQDRGPEEQAIWKNCFWKIFLPGGSSEKDSDLDPETKAILPTLRLVPGQYSEMLIESIAGTRVVARLCLDKYSQMLYSTKGSEFEAIKQLTAQGLSVDQAIDFYLQKNTNTNPNIRTNKKDYNYDERIAV